MVAARATGDRPPGPHPICLASAGRIRAEPSPSGVCSTTETTNSREGTGCPNAYTIRAEFHQTHEGNDLDAARQVRSQARPESQTISRAEAGASLSPRLRVDEIRPLSPLISSLSDVEVDLPPPGNAPWQAVAESPGLHSDRDALPDPREVTTPTREYYPPEGGAADEDVADEYDWREPIKLMLQDLAAGANICPELLHEALLSPRGDSQRLQCLIDRDLLGLFPPVEKPRQNNGQRPARHEPVTSRAKRRAVSLYKKSRTSCARTILAGKWREVAPSLWLQEQVTFWKPLFETRSKNDSREPPSKGPPEWDIVAPISSEEVTKHLKGIKDGAAGPDNRGKKDLLKLSTRSLASRLNLWLLVGTTPSSFREGVTVLIPKSADGALPQNFRPLTLGPILGRLYHRLLADRVEKHYRISDRQKAFRRGDGLAENSYILRTVIDDRKSSLSSYEHRLYRCVEGVRLGLARINIPRRGLGEDSRPTGEVRTINVLRSAYQNPSQRTAKRSD